MERKLYYGECGREPEFKAEAQLNAERGENREEEVFMAACVSMNPQGAPARVASGANGGLGTTAGRLVARPG